MVREITSHLQGAESFLRS